MGKAIIYFILIIVIFNFIGYLIDTFKTGLKYPDMRKKMYILEKEKDQLIHNFYAEKEKIINSYEKIIFSLKEKKEIEEIETKERFLKEEEKSLKIQLAIKTDLSNFKLNNIMIEFYNDFFEKKIKNLENHFLYKKNPSLKSAQILSEIKKDYKNLQIENRQLKLALSEFIPDEEENTTVEKEDSSFDDEIKAYKYGRLPKEQWDKLTYVKKLDTVLERYKNSWKDKLNIGLEFERYCGYLYEKKGYQVKYWGILNGKADGGIDLIAKNKNKILYIQCKYWGNSKTIRENTISQLFGSALKMAIDNGETYDSFIKKVKSEKIRIILLTKTEISEEAKQFCEKLNIIYQEKVEINSNFPRVKLVYGEDKIFYIPTDLQYDNIIFSSTSKEYGRCHTCKEAENLGYRHCYKWRGNN
ncbi:restriction endonuclease [Fusobacterium varium]|uniref:restriction endonuclease n=1 Tax=Fusobacterium varium TaxID=856 RepID=UPI0024203B08|nr:restriction endonuclease [Fusobacterium varium]